MFSDVVMELPKSEFERIIDKMKEDKGVKMDTELTADDLKEMVVAFKAFYKERKGSDFPPSPKNSSWKPSRPFSVRGTTPAPTSTAA